MHQRIFPPFFLAAIKLAGTTTPSLSHFFNCFSSSGSNAGLIVPHLHRLSALFVADLKFNEVGPPVANVEGEKVQVLQEDLDRLVQVLALLQEGSLLEFEVFDEPLLLLGSREGRDLLNLALLVFFRRGLAGDPEGLLDEGILLVFMREGPRCADLAVVALEEKNPVLRVGRDCSQSPTIIMLIMSQKTI